MKVLYLSGAPRVSTGEDSATTGARAHVMGVINALERKSIMVKRYIVGDMMSKKMSGGGAQKKLSSSALLRIAADFYRIYSARKHAGIAFKKHANQVDVIYERFGAFQSLGRPFKREGKTWILETNSPLFIEAKNERKSLALTGLARKLEIRAYKECDVLVCITHELKDIIMRECGIEEDKILVMSNAVDITQFNPEKTRPKKFFEDFTLGFVGNLYAWAGLDLLFEALAILKKEGIKVNAVIVGDGMMREEWEKMTKDLGIDTQVKFTGRLQWDEIPSYLAGFDVTYSGQVAMKIGKMYHSPLKLYEYMAMGKPVLASAFEEAAKLIVDGNNGYLYEPGNLSDLVNKIKIILKEQNFEKVGREARQTIVDQHTWDKRTDLLIGKLNNA